MEHPFLKSGLRPKNDLNENCRAKDNKLKLLTFHRNNALLLGIRTEAGVLDVAQASAAHQGIPLTMDAAIRGGAETLKVLQGLAEQPAAL